MSERPTEWKTPKQVALWLNVSESTIQKWCRKGAIEHRRFGGRIVNGRKIYGTLRVRWPIVDPRDSDVTASG